MQLYDLSIFSGFIRENVFFKFNRNVVSPQHTSDVTVT